MKTFKRILSGVLAAAMTLGAASMLPVSAANISFTDVAGHWAWVNGQIPYLVEKGVLNGYEQANGTYMFKPDGQVKRSEFIKMLDEVFGLTATTEIYYNDVKTSDWFYPYFQKAAAQGYIIDYGTNANPSGEITREEATALLVRYLDLPADQIAETSSLADYSSISSGYREYILRAVKAGIIDGYKENGVTYFKPQKTLSRAEALTILYRAAGCIFNESSYSRDGSAPAENNVITKGGININNVRLNGRNIISEGASSGKITFYDCDINGTLYIRGDADVTFDDCTVENVVISGGSDVTLVSGSQIDTITVETTTEVGIYSGTSVKELHVEYGANDVRVSGDGSLGKAYINARDFRSSMTPSEFEIGNNLTAYFGTESYQGTSDAQNAFEIAPFSSADNSTYYVNVLPSADGRIFYYYTNLGNAPSVSSFDSYFDSSTYYGNFDVRAGEAVSAPTYPASEVSKFEYVVVQLQDDNRKYAPVIFPNSGNVGTGFSTDPYLEGELTIKFRASSSATLYWFYADDGKALSQIDFIAAYNGKEDALKGEYAVTNVKSFTCTLKEKYLENYSYVAFMLKTNGNVYCQPVIVSVGSTGFTTLPTLKTPGTISFKSGVSGELCYYYSENRDLPTAENFKSEYNAAKRSDHQTVKKNVDDTFKYNLDYIVEYPYLVIALRDNEGKYMQPVLVDINFTTGFENAPAVKNSSEIRFRTEEDGTIKYYYTKDKNAPTVAEFNAAYDEQEKKYKGTMDVNDSYEVLEYSSTYAVTYPYMAIMFIDEDDKEYSPVLVELNAILETGFSFAPYVENGRVYFRTEESGEVWYFYTSDNDTVMPEDFEDYYVDEPSYRRGSLSVSKGNLESFEIDEDVLEDYPYIVLAFTDEGDETHPDFCFPFMLDVEQSIISNAGSGLKVGAPDDGKVRVEALYDGRLYWYRTDDKDDLPSSKTNFKTKYDAAESKDYTNLDAGENEKIEFKDYEYIVCALKVDDEYLSFVTIHSEDGVESDSDTGIFDYDKSGYGMDIDLSRDTLYLTPYEDGSVQLYIVQSGSIQPTGDSISVDEDETISIDISFYLDNDIFSELFDMFKYELYVQFTDSSGNTYKPYQIK